MAYSSLMGARVKRKEDPRLITGTATYVGDLKLAGMHHVAFVRSPYAHARIGSIDTSAAAQIPGVVAVVTGQDLLDDYEPMPMADPAEIPSEENPNEQSKQNTHYALSVDRVRHVGEAVAAVIATTAAIAADAAAEVVVDWDPLPAVVDPAQAIAPGAPRLFDDKSSNVEHVWRRQTGDVDAAFARAAHVVKQRMVSQRLSGVPMEGRAVVTALDGTTGGLTIWSSTQAPHGLRQNVAEALRLPENLVRAIAPEVGGGFGVKIFTYPEDIALSALTRRFGLPLQWVETRIEHMSATMHGRAQIVDLEAAVEEDGTVSALRMRLLADLGAYPVAPDIPESTGLMAIGVYRIPAVDIEITCTYTNTTPVAAYRGAGRPEPAYYIERMMDLIARELELDPVELRRRNFIPPEAFPYATPTGKSYDSGDYDLALSRALEIADYPVLRERQRVQRPESDRLVGIGLSCYVEICAFGYEGAIVRVEPTGTVTVFTGISPHGQGQETTFAQMVADQIGVDFDQVVVRHGDTRETPMGQGTMGSRGLAVGGPAIMRAAAKVQEKARRVAGLMIEAAPEDIVLAGGRYQVQGVPGEGLSLAQIADRAYSDDLPDDLEPGLEATAFFRQPPDTNTCPFGAHVAVVEIERETGVVHLVSYFAVDDCGPRISPVLAEGQIHGGLAQGIAQALWEEVVFDENGQLLTGSLMDYTVPRASQFPRFVTDQTVTPTPLNPLGVKGIGEAATIGSTPAVANAVVDALRPFGIRHLDIPMTPEKVWRAMQG